MQRYQTTEVNPGYPDSIYVCTVRGTAMFAPMRPQSGGRVICELASSDGAGATYAVALHTRDRSWRGEAHVKRGDATIALSQWDAPDPPGWLVDYAVSFLRSETKASPGDWPYRIARWRAGPQ